MNIGTTFNYSELLGQANVPPDLKDFMKLLLGQLDAAHHEMVFQLRANPTVFTTNPAEDINVVEGSKPGDIAIYKDPQGAVQVEVFE